MKIPTSKFHICIERKKKFASCLFIIQFSVICPFGHPIFGHLSIRSDTRSAKCLFGEMSVSQMSVRSNVRSVKCLSAKCPFGEMSVSQMSVR